MRNTENISLRLDPEVLRLARGAAEHSRQTLREFFEAALRRHVAAVTVPEERANLLSSVEEAFLARLDGRMKDVLERVAALSAKEAIDQAFAVQILKRILFMATRDQGQTQKSLDMSWDEAVQRVQKRGRPTAPGVAESLQKQLGEANEVIKRLQVQVGQLQEEVVAGKSALANAEAEHRKLDESNRNLDYSLRRANSDRETLEFQLQREKWVVDRLDKQGLNPIGRKTADELRRQFNQEAQGRRFSG